MESTITITVSSNFGIKSIKISCEPNEEFCQMEELTVIKKKSKCHFCGLSKNDILKYGVMYKLGNIVAHYFCVLLSSQMIQRGSDDEGLLGFLYHDIKEELKRSLNVLCTYCKKGNATIKCAYKKCRKNFHLPCGLKSRCLNQFRGSFKSFCHLHCPVQNIPQNILKEASKSNLTCCICYEKIKIKKKKRDTLWAPCCQKTWYHTFCVQKLACSAGYFFRCPACNDIKTFSQSVQEFGIFIPQQDASWELVPNAFEELLFRYNKCDAAVCLCPRGRQGSGKNKKWEIILCESCGSQGIHVACGGFKCSDADWECSECQKITKSNNYSRNTSECKGEEEPLESLKLAEICQKKRRRGSEDLEILSRDKRKKCKQDLQEEEIEIDVETVDGETKDDKTKKAVEEAKDAYEGINRERVETGGSRHQEAFTSIKPGPLSYKLGVLRKALKNSRQRPISRIDREASVTAKPANLFGLSGQEEGKETDNDIEVIEEVEKQTSKNSLSSISPERGNNITVNLSSSETNKSCDFVIFSNDFAKPQDQSSFSLDNFDVLAIVKFQFSGGQKKNDGTVDGFYPDTEEAPTLKDGSTHLSVFPVSLFESFSLYPEKEDFTQNLEHIEAVKKIKDGKKEVLLNSVDDDVIILTD